MTARHMRKAVIQSRRQALRPHENFGEAMAVPVAIGLTEAEVQALARHLSADMKRIPAGSDLLAARDAIFAAALDALADDIKEKDA